jgi:hypothetical protein
MPDEGDECDNEKYMDQGSAHRDHDKAEEPEDQQNYSDGSKHGVLLPNEMSCTLGLGARSLMWLDGASQP